jgi:aminoglycoside phosphotransferase family enzyme
MPAGAGFMTLLSNIVKVLSDAAVYPEPTKRVEVAQTQMSIVFLTDDYVYKVKKPVNLGYLDYTTLQNRKLFCEQEVRLNRRLCADVYLGVIPITLSKGKISLGDSGRVVEYAVKMRKLPRNRMMDVLLAKNKVTPEMITQVADKVAEFHRQTETSPDISKFGTLEVVTLNSEENFSQTEKYVGWAFTPEQYKRIAGYTRTFIKKRTALFQRRVSEGKIRDCHGDLHSQHVCFTHGICIYDCVEFNDRFRYVDVAAEVSFLAMDLDRWGHSELSKQFVSAYVTKSGDSELNELVNFYKCYFAYVRAKVNCFKYDAPLISAEDKEKALKDAKQYFGLAKSYVS